MEAYDTKLGTMIASDTLTVTILNKSTSYCPVFQKISPSSSNHWVIKERRMTMQKQLQPI
jgi:hypothetical protein